MVTVNRTFCAKPHPLRSLPVMVIFCRTEISPKWPAASALIRPVVYFDSLGAECRWGQGKAHGKDQGSVVADSPAAD